MDIATKFASGQEAVEAIFRKDKQLQGRPSEEAPEASAPRGAKKKGKKKSQSKRDAADADLVAYMKSWFLASSSVVLQLERLAATFVTASMPFSLKLAKSCSQMCIRDRCCGCKECGHFKCRGIFCCDEYLKE